MLSNPDRVEAKTLEIVQPNSAIGLTAGTTTFAFARHLRSVSNLTVVTNAPSIAQTLYRDQGQIASVVLTGGVRTPSDALVGPIATTALATLHIDVLFLGVHGMDSGLGYSTPNLAEAEINQAFIESARRVVVLADHTKWGTRGLAQIAPLERADLVISDTDLPDDARQTFETLGVDVALVAPRSMAVESATAG